MTEPKTKKRTGITITELPEFASISACSGATGIPVAALKKAKKGGCPAFASSGRVYLGPLLRWMFKDGEGADVDLGIDWIKEKAKTQTLRERVKLAKEQGSVMDIGRHRESVAMGQSILFAALDRIFASELPPILKGLSELEIRSKILVEIERMKGEARKHFEEWDKEEIAETKPEAST